MSARSRSDLRDRSSEIMDAVEHGNSFVVTRNGSPIGKLVPLRRRRTVSRERFAETAASAPVIDAARFGANLDGTNS